MPADSLRNALLDRIAAQWIVLGVALRGPADDSPIDLEALVLATALVGPEERRVYDGALDWCIAFGTAINVARLRAVADEIGGDPAAVADFAARVASGGGPRWPMGDGRTLPYPSRGTAREPDLRTPALRVWRLRSAFGVTARADILNVLAGTPDQAYALAGLARLTRSTKRTVTLAVRALGRAGLVDVDADGNEQRVRLTPNAGIRGWLGPALAPIDWVARFAVALAVLRFAPPDAASPVVRAIEARALVAQLLPEIRRASLPKPDTGPLGEAFADAFDAWRSELAAAIQP